MRRILRNIALSAIVLLAGCNPTEQTPSEWAEVYTLLEQAGVNTQGLTLQYVTASDNFVNESDYNQRLNVIHGTRNGKPELYINSFYPNNIPQQAAVGVLGPISLEKPQATQRTFDLGYGEQVTASFKEIEVEFVRLSEQSKYIYSVVKDSYAYTDPMGVKQRIYDNLRLCQTERESGVTRSVAITKCDKVMLGWQGSVVCDKQCYSEDLEPLFDVADNLGFSGWDWESLRSWTIPLSHERFLFVRTGWFPTRNATIGPEKCLVQAIIQSIRTGDCDYMTGNPSTLWQNSNIEVHQLTTTKDKYEGATLSGVADGVYKFEVYAILENGEHKTYHFEVDTLNNALIIH